MCGFLFLLMNNIFIYSLNLDTAPLTLRVTLGGLQIKRKNIYQNTMDTEFSKMGTKLFPSRLQEPRKNIHIII